MAPKAPKKGSKKMPPAKPPVNQVAASRCPKCGSTERTGYEHVSEMEFGGKDPEGNEYTHVVRKSTNCKACGQRRIDRILENRPEA